MAELIRRKDVEPTPTRWDPFEMMRDFTAWDPFQRLERSLGPLTARRMFTPAFDVRETSDTYILKADLPGMKEEDVDISLTGNRLTMSGQRREEDRKEGDTYYAVERSYGSFSRTFTVPEGTDLEHISADLKDGVLTVVVPKQEEVKPRRISLKGLKHSVEGIKEKVSEKIKA